MKAKILPVFISFAGCTSRCIYCDQHKITGIKPENLIKSAENQIKEYLTMSVDWGELAFFGGSFTCLPKEIRLSLYKLAEETGINRLRFSTSPDCINSEVLDEASENGVEIIELGVQSLDDDVLKANRRPYSSSECLTAFELIKKNGFKTGIQLMTGLCKEDRKSFTETVEKAAAMGADYARIYPCIVLTGTELAELYEAGGYSPLSLAEACARSAYAYIKLTASGCSVIRTGLHDSASVKDSAAAGPYHPAMGELVKTVVLATFFEMGGKIAVDHRYLNTAYGYGGVLRNMYSASVEVSKEARLDFEHVCRKITEIFSEDSKWKLEEQTACHAERFFGETHNR